MSYHPEVCWLSSLLDIKPDAFIFNKMYLGISNNKFIRNIIQPSEAYRFWDSYYKGFSRPFRDLVREDATLKSKNDIQLATSKLLTMKRNRFICKITGWPRIGFINDIFPDALFIHIIRDGRAVVNSFLNVYFWDGWKGPSNWRFGELSPQEEEIWNSCNKSFVALAALQWVKLICAVETSRQTINDNRFLEIHYEDLCQDSEKIIQRVVEFCNLTWTDSFQKHVNKYTFRNTNDKFEKELNNSQKKIIERIINELGR
jgi:hypothetical protein